MKKIIFSAVAACTLTATSYAQDLLVDKSTLSPKAVVKTWASDMVDGKLVSLWDSLPLKYQADTQGIIHAFGKQMDPAVYNEAMKTLTMANDLLKSKKVIILELMEAKVPADREEQKKFRELKANYSEITGFIDAALKSDIKDVAGLKELDIKKFCKTVQPNFKNLVKAMKTMEKNFDAEKVEVKHIARNGDTALVEVTGPRKGTENVKLTRVENRWLPTDMTTEWDAKVLEAKLNIAKMEKMEPQQKQQVIMMMQMVQGTIKELDKAQTADELTKAVETQMQKFLPLMMMMGGGA